MYIDLTKNYFHIKITYNGTVEAFFDLEKQINKLGKEISGVIWRSTVFQNGDCEMEHIWWICYDIYRLGSLHINEARAIEHLNQLIERMFCQTSMKKGSAVQEAINRFNTKQNTN